ncbi:MAG: GMP synthase (glutamine-hydrolyzing) [Halobacteriales archaeon]
MDKRKDLSQSSDPPEVAFLAPPADFDYPRAVQQVLRSREITVPSTTRFEPHRDEVPEHAAFDLVVVAGSTARIGDPEPWFPTLAEYLRGAISAGTPVLGVCFGHQFLADLLGGTVTTLPERQATVSTIERTAPGRASPAFRDLPERFDSFVYHRDHVADLPDGATPLARDETGVQAFAVDDRPVLGIQFHPEFTESMARTVGYDGPLTIESSRRIYANVLRAARGDRPIAETK